MMRERLNQREAYEAELREKTVKAAQRNIEQAMVNIVNP